MKSTIWTTVVALTLACLGDGLLFPPSAPAATDTGVQPDGPVEQPAESQVCRGLKDFRAARG